MLRTADDISLLTLPSAKPAEDVSNQYHLSNLGTYSLNVQGVWADYNGAGVVVGVVDVGVQATHPDLDANYDSNLDYDIVLNTNDGTNKFTDDWHGTAVAGVIAAEDNGTGTQGVAYGAHITSFRFLDNGDRIDPIDDDVIDAIQRQVTVDVSNNSWGWTSHFADTDLGSQIDDAYADVEANGRGGLGTVFVFAAGNDRTHGGFNVNYNELNNNRCVIDVAASDSDGHIAPFSTPGAPILVTAPGVDILMPDLTGADGDTNGNYTVESGTSFAAPCVSGVVALMLQANDQLGWRDVQEILAYSARQIDTTNDSWDYNQASDWNGGGMHFSSDYGAGLVDALAAVRLAETWQDDPRTSSNEVAFTVNSSNVEHAVQDFTSISESIHVNDDIRIEHVEVQLNLTHSSVGDLTISLVSPDGMESVLVDQPSYGFSADDTDYSSSWSFTTTHDWGERSEGQWTLKIADNQGGDEGVLHNWSLTFYGENLSDDSTYIYTNEYGHFIHPIESDRRLIADGSGNDTINAAAVSTDSNINLNAGTTSTIAGNTLSIQTGTLIENLFTGDGNDTLTSNGLDNTLSGGRGDDSYVFLSHFGVDQVDDRAGAADTLNLAAFHASSIHFWYALDQSGDGNLDQLVISMGAGQVVQVDHFFDDTNTDVMSSGSGAGLMESIHLQDANFTFNQVQTQVNNAQQTLGDSGDNVLNGDVGDNLVFAGDGQDTISGDAGDDDIHGGAGDDTTDGGSGDDNLWGDQGGDSLLGGLGNDYIDGGGGNDMLSGQTGDDEIYGGAGNDTLDGGAGANTLHGGAGDDVLTALSKLDHLYGDAGNDSLQGSSQVDRLEGGDGNDVLLGMASNDTLLGNKGDDTLIGGAGSDKLNGGLDSDTYVFSGAFGADTISDGGGSSDTVDLSAINTSFSINLHCTSHAEVVFGTIGSVNWSGDSIENLITGNGNDTLVGSNFDNILIGGGGKDMLQGRGGDDVLVGGASNDILIGGVGNDALQGGDGSDTYQSFTGVFGDDIISDLSGSDKLLLKNFNLADVNTWSANDTDADTNVDQLVIRLDDGSITINHFFDNTQALVSASGAGSGVIESIQFADHTLGFAAVQHLFP